MTDYPKLVEQVDDLTARLRVRYHNHLVCQAGCSGCCQHHLAVFPVEAASLKDALRALPVVLRMRLRQQALDTQAREAADRDAACPLLVEDRCAVYAKRPLICRTQGLPLLYASEDGEPEVDFCPLNFTAPQAIADLEEHYLIPLDKLNLQLALANLEYCHAQAIPAEQSGVRPSMREVVLEATDAERG